MKMRLGIDTKHSAVQNFTLRFKTCSHNPTFSVVLINLRCYVLGFCWQTSKVCDKKTPPSKHANNHANNARTSWLWCLHHPAWMGASHGWVPVHTHSTPVPTTVGRPWRAQNHTSPILPTSPAWQRSLRYQFQGVPDPATSRVVDSPVVYGVILSLPVVQTLQKIVEIPQEQFFLKSAVDMLIEVQRQVQKTTRVPR